MHPPHRQRVSATGCWAPVAAWSTRAGIWGQKATTITGTVTAGAWVGVGASCRYLPGSLDRQWVESFCWVLCRGLSRLYQNFKDDLLTAYAAISEVYRKRFRNLSKHYSETFSECAFSAVPSLAGERRLYRKHRAPSWTLPTRAAHFLPGFERARLGFGSKA